MRQMTALGLVLVMAACQQNGPTAPALERTPELLIGSSHLSHDRDLELDKTTEVVDPKIGGLR